MKHKIKDIRKEKGLTQAQLAKLLGITPQGVSKIEASENVRIDTLQKVAAALDCNLFDLLGFDALEVGETLEITAENGAITGINRLTEKDRAAAQDQEQKDTAYINRLAVPALKLNDTGRDLLLNDAEKYAKIKELTE